MLRHAHSPKYADAFCVGNHSRHLFLSIYRNAAPFRRELQRERLKRFAILFESIYPAIDELRFREAFFDKITADRREPNEIGPWSRMQEDVSTARHLVLPQIRDD